MDGSSYRPPEVDVDVDLRGHCAFCLTRLGEGEKPGQSTWQGLQEDGTELAGSGSFSHIWGYLLKNAGGRARAVEGSRYKFVGGGRVLETTPPMCGYCGDLIQEMEGLHRELMKKVERIHRIVLGSSKEGGRYSWRREKLRKVLEDSSLEPLVKENTFQFLESLLESSSRCEPTPVDTDLSTSKDFDIGADDNDEYIKEEVELDSYSLASEGGLQDDNSGSELEDDNDSDYDPGDGEGQSCFIDEGDSSGDEDVGRSTLSSPNSKLPGSQKIYSTKKLHSTPHLITDEPSHCPSPSRSVEEELYGVGGEKTIRNTAGDLGDSQLLVKEEIDSPPSSGNDGEDDADFEYQIENEDSTAETESSQSEDEVESSDLKDKITTTKKKPNKGRRLSRPGKPKTQFCDLCHQRISFQEIRQHLEAHNVTDYISKCPNPDCRFTFSNRRSLEALHLWDRRNRFAIKCRNFLNLSSKNNRSFWFLECETCGHEAKDCNSLRDHINKSHESESTWKYPCPIQGCPKQFSVKQRLEYHLKGHDVREEELQRCCLCQWGGKLRDKIDMAEHLKKVHKVRGMIECKQCPFLFPSRKEFLEHMRNHQKEGIICDLCDDDEVKFSIYGEFKQHYYDEHKIGKEFVCRDCGKAYTRKNALLDHRMHNHQRKFNCRYCPQSFTHEENLQPHVILYHPEIEDDEDLEYQLENCLTDGCGNNESDESSSDQEKAVKKKPRRMVPVPKVPEPETEKLSISDQPCDLCRQRIPFLEMRRHLETHNVADYICECPNPDCPYTYSNRRSLEACHLFNPRNRFLECRKFLNLPKNQNTYWFLKCETCGDVSKDYTSLRIHITKFHESKPSWKFTCPIKDCPKQFSVKQSVEYHLRRHDLRDQVIQTCPMCRRSLRHRTKKEMTDHLRQVHKLDEIIECKQCPFIFPSREGLLAHMKQHQEEGIFCDICNDDQVRFSTFEEFRQHYFSAHKIGQEFGCEVCGKAFPERKLLAQHSRKRHKTRKYRKSEKLKCDACPENSKIFQSQSRLQTHKIRVHGVDPFKCQFCEKTFLTKSVLDMHEKLHAGSNIFKCEFDNCGKVFQSRRHYMTHTLRHRKKKICDTCGKEFYSNNGLQQHINSIHLGLKKFPCEVCGAQLATLYSLILHRRRHTGECPYKCNICHMAFGDRSLYTKHCRSQHPDQLPEDLRHSKPKERGSVRPHKCSVTNCNKTFFNRKELIQHLKTQHKITLPPAGEEGTVPDPDSVPVPRRRRGAPSGPRGPRAPVAPSLKTSMCETCGKAFVNAVHLRRHTEVEHLGVRLTCDQCGDKFRSEVGLKYHMNIHSGERPYSCDICETKQAFRTQGALNAHLKRHRTKGSQFRPRGSMKTFRGRPC